MENLCLAWEEFIRDKRGKKDVQDFAHNLSDEIFKLHEDLLMGVYLHGPYKHFRINDPKPRDIHKALVRDRLLHHAIHRQLYPFYARVFIADSFSCQSGKGLHRAINRFRNMGQKESLNQTRTCWVLKCDIRKYFASVDHATLLAILKDRIDDTRITGLLQSIISSFESAPGKGIPLGNLTSQLFANIYLHEFDVFVKHRLKVKWFVRYADDFLLLSHDRDALVQLLPLMSQFLLDRLALVIHPHKIVLQTLASGADFLGWIQFPHQRVLRTKTKQRMFSRVKNHPTQETLKSYLGLLSHGNGFCLQTQIINEHWLRS